MKHAFRAEGVTAGESATLQEASRTILDIEQVTQTSAHTEESAAATAQASSLLHVVNGIRALVGTVSHK